jgi:adenylate cyclase
MLVFLFTDIEGSSRLWEEHTGEMGAVIARHDALLQQQVHACGGRITKHTGDGVTVAFEGGGALACALQTQIHFGREDWGAIGELRIRVGLHAGAAEWIAGAERQGGDYFGPPVNCTARIMSAAWGGQILLTPEVTRASALPARASLKDLGQHLLKDVSGPQQIYQLLHPDLPWQAFPPPRTLSGQSIRQAVDQQGAQMAHLASSEMAVALVSATLLPALQGELDPEAGALEGNLGVLENLGALSLRSFVAAFAQRMPAGERMPDTELQALLRDELQAQWQAGGETALALRSDASRLLQAVHGVQAAMMAASAEVKEALARGLAGLGEQFDEFRWVLGSVQETLTEVRGLQALQLELQQVQLARTEELLALHREPGRHALPAAPEAPAVEPQRPAFLEEGAPDLSHRPAFVAREQELAWLQGRLDAALTGQGCAVFVTGGPGRGKTALLDAFARQAMDQHGDLLVANGTCDAYSGLGDPYLPFREVLGMLSGDVEAHWEAGAIGRDHALRLWQALPAVVEALLAHGPHVVPALLPGEALLARAAAAGPGEPWLARLRERVAQAPGAAGGLEQSHLFQQVSNVLQALALVHPLLLILDDLQWVDRTSAGLLFHLGRRLEGARLLIVGAYRPEEVTVGLAAQQTREGERHLLEKVLAEFKRLYGDVWLDLAEVEAPEGRRFVDAYLETEPNRLGERFRQTLAGRAEGHPLFTVELLRAMQERGDLVRDEEGRWVEGPALDWDRLPARVEGVIGERIERLGEELRQILTVASVEGEDFTAEVVAQVQSLEARALVRRLSGELQREHRLVRARGLRRLGPRRLALYRFQHHLFQQYLYNHLDEAERAYLHEDVGTVLEALYGDQADEVAVQLARHFVEAGVTAKAAHYLGRAGELAAERYANEEAIAHLSQALEYVPVDAPQRLDLLAARAKVYGLIAEWEAQRADLEALLALAEALEDDVHRCDALIALAECLHNTGSPACREPAERAAELARVMGDPLREGRALRFLGMRDYSTGRAARSRSTLEAALARLQEAGQPGETAACLSDLSRALLRLDEPTAALGAAEQAVALSREAGDRRQEAISLQRVGRVQRSQGRHREAQTAIEAALALHREMGDRYGECEALDWLGILLAVLGKPEEAAGAFQQMLKIAEEIGAARAISYGVSDMVLSALAPQGEHEAGLAFLETWLAKAGQAKDEVLAAQLQLEKTRLLWILGQWEPALEVAQGVLPDAERLLDYGYQSWLLQMIGRCQAELGRFRQARETFQAYLKKAEQAGEPVHAGKAWLCLAHVAYLEDDQVRLRAAMEQLPRPDVILPTFWWYHQMAARLQLALGDAEQALESSNRAMQEAQAVGEGWWTEQCYLTHARVLRAVGRDDEADDSLRHAYERVMVVASKIQDEALRQGWLENVPDNREIIAEWEARQRPDPKGFPNP